MNPEHVEVVRQGSEAIAAWRRAHPRQRLDLSESSLVGLYLDGADLSGARLGGVDLFAAHLSGANLAEAVLVKADLGATDLSRANLRSVILNGAHGVGVQLSEADLTGASLHYTTFLHSYFNQTQFSGAELSATVFAACDLSVALGLESAVHEGPSTIGLDTIVRSGGNIPEAFLRGAGVPDTIITYVRSLVTEPLQFYTCFISYASLDQAFAQRLYNDLQGHGVRCWFAPEDMKIGDRIRPAIDQAIRVRDKLLLVLSERSIGSQWVEEEVETALEEERRQKKTVLFPIRLDDAVMETDRAWAASIRRTRHIGDFSHWKEHDAYRRGFDRLLRDLAAKSRPAVE